MQYLHLCYYYCATVLPVNAYFKKKINININYSILFYNISDNKVPQFPNFQITKFAIKFP
jgi:hypothetical protein